MREVRVFIDLALCANTRISLPKAAARHVVRVLRLRAGSSLTVFNGLGGEYHAEIMRAQGEDVAIEIRDHHQVERESNRPLVLLQGIARGERMDLIVQKTTELGITHILPVSCSRSVVQLGGERVEKRLMHWRSVAIAACEQCGRNRVPAIEAPQSLAAALDQLQTRYADNDALYGLLDPEATLSPASWLPSARSATSPIALLIGPEGGLDESEITLARQQRFVGVRLGARILRTETAALAALAAIQSLAGDYI